MSGGWGGGGGGGGWGRMEGGLGTGLVHSLGQPRPFPVSFGNDLSLKLPCDISITS